MKDPFQILNVNKDATQDEISKSYYELRNKYSEERFQEGEAGNIAAKKLTELDKAYEEIQEMRSEQVSDETSSFGQDRYAEVAELIKQNKLDEAQRKLDAMENRSGEWHYLLSVIYFKKGWHLECKKQLEIAINLEPNNSKYKAALNKLNDLMTGKANEAQRAAQAEYQRSYQQDQTAQMGNCCCQLAICDACCPFVDLNPCC